MIVKLIIMMMAEIEMNEVMAMMMMMVMMVMKIMKAIVIMRLVK